MQIKFRFKCQHVMYRVGQNDRTVHKSALTSVRDDLERHSVNRNVQLFIGSKTDSLHVAIFE